MLNFGFRPHWECGRGSLGAEQSNGRTLMRTAMRMSVLASAAFVALGGTALAQQQAPQSPNMTFFVTSVGSGKGGEEGHVWRLRRLLLRQRCTTQGDKRGGRQYR